MKGKIGLVVGLGVGYVLGTRAGRERYEQIKEAAGRVWEMDPVQAQVTRVKGLARSTALAVPRLAWKTVVKLVHATSGAPAEKPVAKAPAAKPTAAKSTASKSTASKPAATQKKS